MRVLLEEVVLDLPHGVEPEPVGELDLVERVAQQLLLGVRVPRARELVLVEDPEAHARASYPCRGPACERTYGCDVLVYVRARMTSRGG